jgi:hypothetical protein
MSLNDFSPPHTHHFPRVSQIFLNMSDKESLVSMGFDLSRVECEPHI